MARVGDGVTCDERAQVGIGDPVEQASAQDACAEATLPGDDKDAPRAQRRLAEDEIDDLAVGGILRVSVEVEARVNLVLAATNAALAREIFGRAGPMGPWPDRRRGDGER